MSIHNIPFLNVKDEIILNHPKSAAMGLFQGTQERVRNSRGKRAISVRAIEVPLYYTVAPLVVTLILCRWILKLGIELAGSVDADETPNLDLRCLS